MNFTETTTCRECYTDVIRPPSNICPNCESWLRPDEYSEVVQMLGHEVLAFAKTENYSGSWFAALKNASGEVGLLVGGYGSCSGCDVLEWLTPNESGRAALADYVKGLGEEIAWGRDAVLETLKDQYLDGENRAVIPPVLKALGLTLAEIRPEEDDL